MKKIFIYLNWDKKNENKLEQLSFPIKSFEKKKKCIFKYKKLNLTWGHSILVFQIISKVGKMKILFQYRHSI